MRGRRSLALRRRTLSQAASGVCMDSVQLERSAPMFGACAGAVFRRGVRRGAVSRDFSPADILVELAALDHYPSTVSTTLLSYYPFPTRWSRVSRSLLHVTDKASARYTCTTAFLFVHPHSIDKEPKFHPRPATLGLYIPKCR